MSTEAKDSPRAGARRRRTFVLACAILLAGHGAPGLRGAPVAVGQAFPSLADFTLEGAVPDLAAKRVVVVDFWASWCTPCRAAFPVLDELQREFGEKGLQIVAVSVDRNKAAMDTFLKKRPVGFAIVRDAQMKLVERVDVPSMPTTFVLDGTGTVRFVHAGFHGDETRRELREQIIQLLEEKP